MRLIHQKIINKIIEKVNKICNNNLHSIITIWIQKKLKLMMKMRNKLILIEKLLMIYLDSLSIKLIMWVMEAICIPDIIKFITTKCHKIIYSKMKMNKQNNKIFNLKKQEIALLKNRIQKISRITLIKQERKFPWKKTNLSTK